MGTELLYLNGSFLPLCEGRIEVEDRGFQLGDGVYEVIKVMNGRLVWLEDHLARLERSLAAVRLTEAAVGHELAKVLPRLVAEAGVSYFIMMSRAPYNFDLYRRISDEVVAAFA